ncbi:MAG: hypothetical protein V8R80_09540 [Eubacterium sp.]
MEQIIKAITEKQNELHIHQFAFTTTDQLVFSQGVRDLCEQNSCGHYGRTSAMSSGCRYDRRMQSQNHEI